VVSRVYFKFDQQQRRPLPPTEYIKARLSAQTQSIPEVVNNAATVIVLDLISAQISRFIPSHTSAHPFFIRSFAEHKAL
jgi:hypothetical protein